MRVSLATVAFSFVVSSAATAQTTFVSVMEDVPLAPGLSETGTSLSFAGAEGQILQAAAAGAGEPASVARYYADALPALGWSSAPETATDRGAQTLIYERGRERLVIKIAAPASGRVELKFRLVARQASPKLD